MKKLKKPLAAAALAAGLLTWYVIENVGGGDAEPVPVPAGTTTGTKTKSSSG